MDGGVDVAAVEASVSVDVAGEFDDADLGDAGDVGGDGAFGDAEVAGDLGAGAALDAHLADALEAVADAWGETQWMGLAFVATWSGGRGHMRIIVRDIAYCRCGRDSGERRALLQSIHAITVQRNMQREKQGEGSLVRRAGRLATETAVTRASYGHRA